jgi:hypothetical protein
MITRMIKPLVQEEVLLGDIVRSPGITTLTTRQGG